MPRLTIGAQSEFAHDSWSTPPLHIPDGNGGAYKTELVITRYEQFTEKRVWWYAPDPRRHPHNHPWDFKSTILYGGYRETRWDKNGNCLGEFTYRQYDVNDIKADVFHTVDEVFPGTVTNMVTGPLVGNGDWGYLIDGKYVSAKDDPFANKNFLDQLRQINPHKRPK